MAMTKQEAVALYGNQVKLASALGISKQAVSKWPPDKPIPELYELRIRFVLKPKGLRKRRRKQAA